MTFGALITAEFASTLPNVGDGDLNEASLIGNCTLI